MNAEIRGFIVESTSRPGTISIRLNRNDPTVTPLFRLLTEAGFKPGDAFVIRKEVDDGR